MVIHDLGAEATDIEHLRTSWFIWREVGSTGYPDVSVIRYIDDSSDHRYGTFVHQIGIWPEVKTWRIAQLEHKDDNKEVVDAWSNNEDYTLPEVIRALSRGGYHGGEQIASYMMKHCDLEKEKNDED